MLERVAPTRVRKWALGAALALAFGGNAYAGEPGGTYVVPGGLMHTTPLGLTGTGSAAQVIAAAGSSAIYVSNWAAFGASGTIQFEYGTGATCTSPTTLTDAIPMASGAPAGMGAGFGVVLAVPSGKTLCAIATAAAPGVINYTQY